jgi:hypothetical protein
VAEFESGKNQIAHFVYKGITLPVISTLLNSLIFKMETVNDGNC